MSKSKRNEYIVERLKLYVPDRLTRYYRRVINKKPHKYFGLSQAIERARLPVTTPRFYALAQFYAILSMIPGALLGYFITIAILPLSTLESVGIRFREYFPLQNPEVGYQIIVSIALGIFAYFFVKSSILSYPYYIGNIRRGKIETAMPHAVNMILGMARGGVPLIASFRFIAENKHIFDEASVEFGKIVELIELFGQDMLTAIRYVIDTTPSEKFATFLDNFVNVIESGGSVIEYLNLKSQQLLEEKEKYYTVFFETMQVLAEIYLAMFIVAPLFFLTVLVVFQILQGGVLEGFRFVLFAMLPLGSLMIIYIISQMMPKEPASTIGERLEVVERLGVKTNGLSGGEFKVNKIRAKINRIKRFLLTPFNEVVYSLTLRAISFYLLIPPIVFVVVAYGRVDFETLLVGFLLFLLLPLIIFVEYREWLIRKIEKQVPDFLRQLAGLNEAGLNVVEALKHITAMEMGILSREIVKIKRDLEWGELVSEALKKFETRVRSSVISRVVSLIVKAVESTPTIKEALYTASLYSEMEIEAKERIRTQMSMYTLIIYIAFGVFLYTSYVLLNNIMSIFTSIQELPAGVIAEVNLNLIKETFYQTALLVGFFSGFTAGMMGEGKLEAGFKHVLIFMVVGYIFFRKFIVF